MRSYVEMAGSAKIKIEDHMASVTFSRFYYGGMWGAAPP
jgi:hypothetical protein